MQIISARRLKWLKAIEELKHAAVILAAGFLVCVGYRAGEWFIPKPSTRVLICMADELGTVGLCRDMDELVKKHHGENHENR